MRTNGLVWALALSMCATAGVRANDELGASQDEKPAVFSGNEEILNNDTDCGDLTYFSQQRSSYFLYAGSEFTFLDIRSRTGGVITASFSDTTAPGVATSAFREVGGSNDWG